MTIASQMPAASVPRLAGSEGSRAQMAAIHIGGSSASMLIAERTEDRKAPLRLLEFLEQPLPLASDVFERGALSSATIERCVAIIRRFQEALLDYGMARVEVKRVAVTNIISEARNEDVLLNRVEVACGLTLTPLDEGDMTRLVYMQGERLLKKRAPDGSKRHSLVVHLGPGNTRLLLFHGRRIAHYTSYRMGAFRITEAVDQHSSGARLKPDVIEGHINGVIEQIAEDYDPYSVEKILILGEEIQIVSRQLSDDGKSRLIEVGRLEKLMYRIAEMDVADIAAMLGSDEQTAGVMVAVLQANLSIVRRFDVGRVHIPSSRFEETMLMDLVGGDFSTKRVEKEIIGSAIVLGHKFRFEIDHARHVEQLCVRLFEDLRTLHGLLPRHLLLLRVAAILHEVGSHVSRRSHHKHSYYLIRHSEIFGLNDEETMIVALVARYHRQASPSPNHANFRDLDRSSQMVVSKMAALLRVADALERRHSQRVTTLTAEVKSGALVLDVGALTDVTVEELAMKNKGDLFVRLFGLGIRIRGA